MTQKLAEPTSFEVEAGNGATHRRNRRHINTTKEEFAKKHGTEDGTEPLSEDTVVTIPAPPNLVPRSHSVTGNVRSSKVRFRACSVPARPEIRAFLSLRMFVLSGVILGNFAEQTWISRVFLKRFFSVEDKETLNLSRNRKERYNGRVCLKIVGATAESLKRALRLN